MVERLTMSLSSPRKPRMSCRGLFLDPDRIFKFENHDEAYYTWRDSLLSERILLHIDAHHDMYGAWPDENDSVTIANFILPAIQQNVVREVVWAVSDGTWARKTGRSGLRRAIATLRRNGIAGSKVHESETNISTTVFGRPLTICTIRQLPSFSEPVLLDVDVDFFVIPNSSYRGSNIYSRLPWLWPHELVVCLADKKVQTDLVTIAYSVEGGYTPLQWKYLGDELAVRLQHGLQDGPVFRGMDAMRVAACAADRGDFSAAAKAYIQAKILLPHSAAPDFHLSHAYAAMGLPELGRAHYREALALDHTYRTTAYNSTGLAYYMNGRWKASSAAHERTLVLDETDPYAHLGLGLLSLRAKSWRRAKSHFCRTLLSDELNVDAMRGLGAALVGIGDSRGAIRAYERSLKYALLGCHSLFDGVIASRSRARLTDLGHGQTHIEIAKLYARMGDIGNALAGYRMGIAAGNDGVWIRLHVARLLFRRGRKSESVTELRCAFGRLPSSIRFLRHRIVDHMRHRFSVTTWRPRSRLNAREGGRLWM
jgi:tetratricopeptide (TPR) repeat protein